MQSVARSEDWFKIVHGSVPFSVKRSDLSTSLAKIISNISEDIAEPMESEDNPCSNKVDYKAIYEFLGQLSNNKYPKGLRKRESLALLSLVDNLVNMVEDFDTGSEEDYIKSGHWWKSDDSGSNVTKSSQQSSIDRPTSSRQDIERTDERPTAIEKSNPDMPSSDPSRGDDSFDDYFDLPKIRKVRECLNPLKVPIHLLLEEHHTLSYFFD